MAFKYRPIPREVAKDRERLKEYDAMLQERRGYTSRKIKNGESFILLLSGGLDSIGMWIYLLEKYNARVFPIYIFYHHLHTSSYNAIRHYEKILKNRYPDLFEPVKTHQVARPLFEYSKFKRDFSSRIDFDTILHNLSYDPERKMYVPILTSQPSRLGIFAHIALEYALLISLKKRVDVRTIIYGLMPEEDRLRRSELPYIRSLSMSLCELTRDDRWNIMAPIEKKCGFYLTKPELVTYCERVGIGLQKTWSCGTDKRAHCGNCFNCYARKKAFNKAGIRDTTRYHYPALRTFLSKLHRSIFIRLNKIRLGLKKNKSGGEIIFDVNRKIIANPKIQWRKENGQIFILNEVAGCIEEWEGIRMECWELLLTKPTTMTEIMKQFKITKNTCLKLFENGFRDNLFRHEKN